MTAEPSAAIPLAHYFRDRWSKAELFHWGESLLGLLSKAAGHAEVRAFARELKHSAPTASRLVSSNLTYASAHLTAALVRHNPLVRAAVRAWYACHASASAGTRDRVARLLGASAFPDLVRPDCDLRLEATEEEDVVSELTHYHGEPTFAARLAVLYFYYLPRTLVVAPVGDPAPSEASPRSETPRAAPATPVSRSSEGTTPPTALVLKEPPLSLPEIEAVVAQLGAYPPSSALWDRWDELLDALNRLRTRKVDERPRPRQRVGELLAHLVTFAETLTYFQASAETWTAERAAEPVDEAAVALATLLDALARWTTLPATPPANIREQRELDRQREEIAAAVESALSRAASFFPLVLGDEVEPPASGEPQRLNEEAPSATVEVSRAVAPPSQSDEIPSAPRRLDGEGPSPTVDALHAVAPTVLAEVAAVALDPPPSVATEADAVSAAVPALGAPLADDAVAVNDTPAPSPPPRSTRPPSPAAPLSPGAPVPCAEPLVGGDLPPELHTYDAFRDAWLLTPTGGCARVPWAAPGFARDIQARIEALLDADSPDLRRLWVFTRAAAQCELRETLQADEVLAIDALGRTPQATDAGTSPLRAPRLRAGLDGLSASATASWQWRAALETLRPHDDAGLSAGELEDLHDLVGMPVLLGRLLRGLAELREGGEDGVAVLQRALADRRLHDEALVLKTLGDAREALWTVVTTNWSSGSFVQRTHCREAWSGFMRTIGPSVQRLYPHIRGGDLAIVVAKEREWVRGVFRTHAQIADAQSVKFIDRKKMDRMALRLQEHCTEVLDAAARLDGLRAKVPRRAEVDDLCGVVEQLRAQPDQPRAPGHSLTRFVVTVLDGAASSDPPDLSVTEQDVLAAPSLLRLLGEPTEPGTLTFDLDAISDARRAAALFLDAPEAPVAEATDLLPWAEAHWPEFLPAALLGRLSDAERARLQRKRARVQEDLEQRVSHLDQERLRLTELAHPTASGWAQVTRDAGGRLADPASLPNDLGLFRHWLEQCLREAVATRERTVAQLERALDGDGGGRAGVDQAAARRALQAGRYADALRLLGESEVESTDDRGGRETLWRWDALARFPDARASLLDLPNGGDLVALWVRGVSGNHREDQKLRTQFREQVLAAAKLDARSEPQALRIDCQQVRRWIDEQGHNPSGLPQIGPLSRLAVITPAARVDASQFARALADQVAPLDDDAVLVLAPRITAETRSRVMQELRRRRLNKLVGLVDDLDLYRMLLAPGVIALFEVLLEQQRWSEVSPFQIGDGQAVLVEMYFGRAEEARRLRERSDISRVFSGRRLGKSALLRSIEQTQDRRRGADPSEQVVVYVPAAGIDDERLMVDEILKALAARVAGFAPPPAEGEGAPSERLVRVLTEFLDARPRQRLLFFLDEADVFVEAQLREYQTRSERVLSFVMRSRLESLRDDRGDVRVRFVFTGYRVTQTNRGPWQNWGDVLRLRPLDPADATALLVRPLARLGVDARAEAPSIAMRCGHQPAVILRFGQQLLEVIERRYDLDRRTREPVVVSPQDVATVFDGEPVRNEILQVVRNNFQGNRVGELVHGVLLQEFTRHPPGHVLDEPIATVRARFEALSGDDLGWLAGGGNIDVEIGQHLGDLADRELLVAYRSSAGTGYSLRFPHLLPILLPLAEPTAILRQLGSLREAAGAGAAEPLAEGALPDAALDALRRSLDSRHNDVDVLAVVASHWPAPLEDRRVGLAVRLDLSSPGAERSGPAGSARFQERATGATLARAVGDLQPGVRMVLAGGSDLLRAALGLGTLQGEHFIEHFSDRRWSPARLRGWFHRVRVIEFEADDALAVITQRTGGIPLLIGRFDDALRARGLEDGATVSTTAWNRVISDFDAGLPEVARALVEGPPATRLTLRETELLRMMLVLEASPNPRHLAEQLTTLWELHQDRLPVPPVAAHEWTSVELLQALGLLPSLDRSGLPDERLSAVGEDDPIRRLVQLMPA